MSTTIDQRVVEMRFDNANFESNVKTSLSTLEKLKRALKFEGASKGLENIQTSANKVNFSGMSNSIDTVNAKFSYLQMTIQHQLNNIVDSAVNAGKRMVSALTIDPVKSGLQEYETQINSVQTILANTQHNGTTLDEVNNALDELNTYADKTIYNFTQMTRNIGTFTAAGVDLKTSVESIQGIANLAAVSGSTSQQASTAMYQLSQALAAGKVSLMDWNSVVNAGMGGKVFQDALVRTSELLKTGAKEAINTYGSFRESLTKGEWLTTEVLTETLKQLSGAYTEADLIAQGFTKEQAKEIAKLAETAVNAATKVKTFTQLWDTLKEAAQSGWTQTWELIIGDFSEAQELLTKISDVVGNFINKTSETRNNILGGALKSPWKKFIDDTTAAGVSTDDLQNKIQELYDKANGDGAFDSLIEKEGSFEKACRSGAVSTDLLKKALSELGGKMVNLSGIQKNLKIGDAGDDVKKVQEALKQLNYDLGDLGEGGVDGIIGSYTESAIKAFQEANNLKVTGVVDEETIKALEKATTKTNDLTKSFDVLDKGLNELGGREKIFAGLGNIMSSFGQIVGTIRDAFRNIFPAKTTDEYAKSLGNVIDKFYNFTEKLKLNTDSVKQLHRTFKGLFAVLDIVRTIAGGGLSIAFKVLTTILGAFDLNILSFTAKIGDMLVAFRDWILQDNLLAQSINGLIAKLPGAIEILKAWWGSFKETPAVKKFSGLFSKLLNMIENFAKMKFDTESIKMWADNFKQTFVDLLNTIPNIMKQLGQSISDGLDVLTGGKITELKNFLSSFAETPEMEALAKALGRLGKAISGLFSTIGNIGSGIWDTVVGIGRNIVEGLQNGIGEGGGDVVSKIIEVATNLINAFCDLLGIQSPSTVAFSWGKYIIMGLVGGLLSYVGLTTEAGQTVVDNIKSAFENSKLGEDIMKVFNGIFDYLSDENGKLKWDKILAILTGIGASIFGKKVLNIFENLTAPMSGLGEILESAAHTVSTFTDNLPKLMKSFSKMTKGLGKMFKGIGFEHKTEGIKNLAMALLMLVGAIAIVSIINPDRLWKSVGVILGLVAIMTGLSIAMSKLSDTSIEFSKNEKGFGGSIKGLKMSLAKMAAAILMVAIAAKIVGGMNQDEIKKGLLGVAAIALGLFSVAAAISFLTKGDLGKNADKVGKMMSKLAFSMLLMIGVVKLSGTINLEEALKATAFALAFGGFVIAITKVAKSAGNNVGKVGGMILKISIAMALMVGLVKLISLLSVPEMIKGGIFALAFAGFVALLVKTTKIGKRQQTAKLTGLLLSVSVALGIMGGICKLLGSMSLWELTKGVAAIAIFTTLIKSLINTVKDMGTETPKLARTLLAFAGAIAILTGVTFLLGQMDPSELLQGLAVIAILSLFIDGLVKATKDASDVKGTIVAIAICVGVMAASIAALSMIDPKSLIAPTIALGVLMGMFALIVKSSKDVTKSVGTLIVTTVAIGVMATALGILSLLDPKSLIAPTVALGVLMGMFAIMMRSLRSVDMKLAPLITITAIIVVLGTILYMLKDLDTRSALSAAAGITLLLTSLIVATKLMNKTNSSGLGSMAGLAVMTAIIAVLGIVLSKFKDIDAKSAIGGAAAIAILLAAMVGILYLCAGLSAIAPQAIGGAILLGVFILLLAGVAWLVSKIAKDVISDMPEMAKDLSDFMTNLQPFLDGASNIPDSLFGKLAALSAGMVVLGLGEFVLSITNLLSNILGTSMPSLASELSGFMTNLQPFLIGSAVIPDGIAGKLTALSAGMVAIGIGEFITAITNLLSNILGSSMPSLASELSGFMINLAPFLLGSMMIPDGIAGKLTALSAGMVAIGIGECLTAFTNLLSNILGSSMPSLGSELSGFMMNLQPFLIGSMMIPDGIAGKLTSLSAGMVAIGIGEFITAITNLLSNILGSSMPSLASELSGFMMNLQPFLIGSMMIPDGIAGKLTSLSAGMVAIGIGEFITAITNLLSNLLGSSMPSLGSELSGFMTNLQPFLIGSAAIPDGIAGKLTSLSAGIVALGIGNCITALTNLLSNIVGQDLPTLGSDLGGFMTNVMPFITGVSRIPDDISAKIDLLTSAIGELTTENFWKNIKEFFSGGDNASLANLGAELTALGTGLSTFSTSANTFSVSTEALTSITTFIDDMTSIDSSVTDKISDLSGSITEIAKSISDFSSTTAGMDTSGVNIAVTTAGKIKTLINSLSNLDTSGVTEFTGVGIGGIGADGVAYEIAQAMKAFSDKVSGIDTAAVSTASTAALKIKSLIASLSGLDTSSIENFKPQSIGKAMKSYANAVGEIDTGVVSKSIAAAYRLKSFISGLSGLDSSGISNFRLGSIGKTLQTYSESVAGIDMIAITNSISAGNKMKNFISSLAGLDTSGVASFKSAITTLGKTDISGVASSLNKSATKLSSVGSNMVSSMISGLESKSSSLTTAASSMTSSMLKGLNSNASTFRSSGSYIMAYFVSGINSKKGSVSTVAASVVSGAVSRIREQYDSFDRAGKYLGDGLVLGINSKKQAAYDAGYALGKAAAQGEKDGQKSNSPSKLTIQAGKWLGEGLVIGIGKMTRSVYKAGYNLGDSAVGSISSSIAKISEYMSEGIESVPTIRPIMDLSDVESGVGAINGMFNDSMMIGATANVGAISSMMNERIQNGTNEDVVSAINKLGKQLSGMNSNTYNIGGVTYDDGSNISEAVESLVSAARVERRR